MSEIWLLLAAIAVGALSSGAESGFYAMNTVQLRHLGRHSAGARLLLALVTRPAAFLCTLLVAKNVVDDLAVHAAIRISEAWFGSTPQQAGLLAALFLTPLMFFAADAWPKHWALADPVRRLTPLALPLTMLRWLLAPVTAPLVWLLRRFDRGEQGAPVRHQFLALLVASRNAPPAQAPVLAAAGRALESRGRGLRPYLRHDLPLLPAQVSRADAVAALARSPDGLALIRSGDGGLLLLDAGLLALAGPEESPLEQARALPTLPLELDLAEALQRLRRMGVARALVGGPGQYEGICDLESILGLLLAPASERNLL